MAMFTKMQRVEQYLNRLMKGRYFKIDDLLSLTASSIKENSAIMDIGLTTIQAVLGDYKARYRDKSSLESGSLATSENALPSMELSLAEIEKLRNIIQWFEGEKSDPNGKYNELIAALTEYGIDHNRIVLNYRKQKGKNQDVV